MKTRPLHTFAALYLLAALFAVALTGCAPTPPAAYIAADRHNYRAVKPLLEMTAADHPDLSQAITDKLVAWDKRLTAAERALGAPTTQP